MNEKDIEKDKRKALITARDQKAFVIDPNVLDPLIGAYDNSNRALKVENASLRNDVTKLSDALEMMVNDNTKLRGYIDKKNGDLVNVLDTVGL